MEKIFNPTLSDTLVNWDNLAIKTGKLEKRKTIWAIADLMDGRRRDRGEIIAELQKWNRTPEVERIMEWITKLK